MHIYACKAGHKQEVYEGINVDKPRRCGAEYSICCGALLVVPAQDIPNEYMKCSTCGTLLEEDGYVSCSRRAVLVPDTTAKPILKKGVGGFYSPTE